MISLIYIITWPVDNSDWTANQPATENPETDKTSFFNITYDFSNRHNLHLG